MPPTAATAVLNRYSSRITQPRSQGASQAMLLGTGLQPADLDKPQVGIASMWYEGNTCNMHLDKLAARVREGVTAAGMVGMRFNTIGVSDGISMGTDGMSFSLPSRDIIADSIETVMQAQWYDGLVAIPGCDKNMPGCLIAMGRLKPQSAWQDALATLQIVASVVLGQNEIAAALNPDDQHRALLALVAWREKKFGPAIAAARKELNQQMGIAA
jgi:hypothetical protein